MAAAGRASERGASIEAASNRHAPALFLLRSAAAGTGAYLALQRHVPPDLVLVVVRAGGGDGDGDGPRCTRRRDASTARRS